MIKNYWIKQLFLLAVFLFSEIFIFLALMSAKNYLVVAIWVMHLIPLGLMLVLMKNKIIKDIKEFPTKLMGDLMGNMKAILEDIAQEVQNGTERKGTD